MEISYTKDKEFKLTGKNITIAFNPSKTLKADVVFYSLSQKEDSKDSNSLIFDGPGEYEVKGSMIAGVKLKNSESCTYVASVDEIKVAYLSDISSLLNDDELDLIGNVDILLIAIDTLSATDISKVISQIEPRVVIPMSYSSEQLKAFEAEVGTVPSPIDKYKISKKDLAVDTQQIVVLKG